MYMYVYFYILVYAMLDYVHIQMYWVVISFWPGDASNRSSTVLPIVFACLINVIHVMNKSLFRRLLTCGIVAVTAVVWPAIHRNRRASLKLIEPVHWLGKEKRSPSTGMTILESTSDFVHSIPKSPLPALMYLMRIAIDSWIVLCTWSMRVTDLSKCQQLQEDAKQLKLRCGEAGSQPSFKKRMNWSQNHKQWHRPLRKWESLQMLWADDQFRRRGVTYRSDKVFNCWKRRFVWKTRWSDIKTIRID